MMPWNKGMTFEYKSRKSKGRKDSLETKTKKSIARQSNKNPMFGIKRSKETIAKIVAKRKETGSFKHTHLWCISHSRNVSGEKNGAWKGGISVTPYIGFTSIIKEEVKKRDNQKCIQCGKENNLQIHHIDYNKKNSVLSNLVALCKSCHSKTNFKRQMWYEYFKRTYFSEQNIYSPLLLVELTQKRI